MTRSSHAADRASEKPTFAQLRELMGQIERGQVTKSRLQYFLRGGDHIIDCDADPFIPDDWTVEEHRKQGQFIWDPSRLELYLSPNQKDGRTIMGYELHAELVDKPTLNANVLEYLLKHPHLIPEEWKRTSFYIYFWGTVYRNDLSDLFVRCLCFSGEHWYCSAGPLYGRHTSQCYIPLLAN